MGRRSSSKQLITESPQSCCYCGGNTAAETIDHVPSVQFFDRKDASFTLRVPSCAECNSRTAASEQVIAFLARIMRAGADSDDIKSVFKGFCDANPQLSRRLLPTANMVRNARRTLGSDTILHLDDAELQSHVQIVGAKWAFALHKEKFGTAIPNGGGVWVKWWSNVDRMRGPVLPDELELVLPQLPEFLKTGSKKTSQGQFEFVFRKVDDSNYNAGLFFVSCGATFAMLLVTSENEKLLENVEKLGALIHRPQKPLTPIMPIQLGPFLVEHYRFQQILRISL